MGSERSKQFSIAFLLPLWGQPYITNFLDFSLRTLLAPGNIPSINQDSSCLFLFLSQKKDIEIFRAHPAYQRLASHCQIEFIEISDLIIEGNHSATLTLSYERGMRSLGRKMCETYFFFLVSDYIMANDSLKNIKNYLSQGFSGLTTGNFLVVEECMAPLLKEKIAADPNGVLSIESRELLSLGFSSLHPITQAQIVNHGLTHSIHANRFFWKVNDQMLVGRFYLRHMFCIKPEVDDYLIGSFCDYSFIPEMCPSGKVAHIQDSDLFCLIEMAPYLYERKTIAPGGYSTCSLAHQLSRWTTAVHRANAHIPMIYHTTTLHSPPSTILQESEKFIRSIESHLSLTPQSTRSHPYWVACLKDIFHQLLQHPHQKRDSICHNGVIKEILGSPTFSHIFDGDYDDRSLLTISQPKKRKRAQLQNLLSGSSFQTRFWHPHWCNETQIKKDLRKKISSCKENVVKKNVVIAFEAIPNEIDWLEHQFPNQCVYFLYDSLMARTPQSLGKLFEEKTQVFIWLRDNLHYELMTLLQLILRYLPKSTSISIYLRHQQPYPQILTQQMASICTADLQDFQIGYEIEAHSGMPFPPLTAIHHMCNTKAFGKVRSPFTRIGGYLGLTLLLLANTFFNLLGLLGFGFRRKVNGATLVFSRSLL